MKTKLTLGLLGAMFILGWNILSLRKVEPAPDRSVQAPTSSTPAPREPAKAGTTNVPGIGPVPADPKAIARLKAKLNSNLDSAFRQQGFLPTLEEIRAAEDSGDLAWIFIEKHKSFAMAMEHITKSATEPFPPRLLEALEHILKRGTEAQMKLTAAVLLFRYDQPGGKEYLLKVVNSPAVDMLTRDVIFVLAKNRVPEAVPGIAAAYPKMGAPYEIHHLALGQWGDPGVLEAVRRRYAAEPKNYGYALCLAQAGDAGSVAPLRAALATRGSTPTGNVLRSALARVGALDAETWHAEMELAWANHRSLSEAAIIHYFDAAGPAVAKGMAEQCLKASIPLHEAYVAGMESQAKGIREKIPELANKFPKPPPSEFIMGAAQLLAQWDAKEAVPTLQQVLTTVQQGGRANVYVNEALGLALHKLDPANWRETLLNAGIPPYHVDRIPALAKLRPIPPAYLPKQVNLNAR